MFFNLFKKCEMVNKIYETNLLQLNTRNACVIGLGRMFAKKTKENSIAVILLK